MNFLHLHPAGSDFRPLPSANPSPASRASARPGQPEPIAASGGFPRAFRSLLALPVKRLGVIALVAFLLGASATLQAQELESRAAGPVESAPVIPETDRTASEDVPDLPREASVGHAEPRVLVGSGLQVRRGQLVGSTVVVGGNLSIEEGAVVDGDVVVVGGELTIDGEVSGDVVAVLGSTRAGPTAIIHGDLVAIGASDIDPGASVLGDSQSITLGKHAAWVQLRLWFSETILLGRPWSPSIPWMQVLVLILIGCATVFALLLPGSLRKVSDSLRQRPAACLGAGLLVQIALPAAFVLLLAGVIGLFVNPILLAVGAVFSAVGLAGVGAVIGRGLGLNAAKTPVLALATLVGCLILAALLAIPFAGAVFLYFLGTWGLGGVLLALWNDRAEAKVEPAGTPPEPSRVFVPPAKGRSPETASEVPPPQSGLNPAPYEIPALPPAFASEDGSGFDGAAPRPAAPAPAPLPPVADKSEHASRLQESIGLATFWQRAGAFLLDCVLIGFATGILDPLVSRNFNLFPVLFIAYHLGFWTWKGTTIGGAIFRIRIQRPDGGRLTAGTSLVRLIVCPLALIPFGYGWWRCGHKPDRLAWQDIVAGTQVVQLKPGISLF